MIRYALDTSFILRYFICDLVMKISEHTLNILQYDDVIQIIARECVTAEGRDICKSLRPSTDYDAIEYRKKVSENLFELHKFLIAPPIRFFPPVLTFLQEDKTTLEIEAVFSIGMFTKRIAELKKWHADFIADDKTTNAAINEVVQFISQIPDCSSVEQSIFSLIDENGNLQNIPSLKKIEREIGNCEKEMQKLLARYFIDETFSGMLQSSVPTTRDGRQVLAVKANFKGRISGIIHEYSQTGQTFYIEPSDVVEKNNDLFEAHARYNAELRRLLLETTQKIYAHKDELTTALNKYAELDCMYAGVKIAREQNWNFLVSNENTDAERIFLQQARHPLLKNPIPIDIVLPEKTRVLIITGPNAGGKTVSLKTLCLFALLNQSGFPVPCSEKSELPFFDFIACDIGDDQSIDLSLSTFSSHMKNIADILKNATSKSLIALDELGNGTEPQEGSAIAMAVLDELLEKRPFVFVTTHHASLKNYGYTKDFCENASVEFDNTTLEPQYKIIMGVPGESHAFDIAAKSGLNANIIANAKNFLGENKTDVSALIKGLIEKNKTSEEMILRIKEKEQSLNEKIRKVDLKELTVKQKELHLREQGYRKAENFFIEKRRELENIIREIREGELTKEKIADTKMWLADFENALATEKTDLKTEAEYITSAKNSENVATDDLQEGDEVFSLDYNRSGTVLRKEKDGVYLVQLGNMKLKLKSETLRIERKSRPLVSVGVELTKSEKPAFELRLLGMREQEAKKALTTQLDLAVLSSLKEFSIVHGKGDGILQKMTQGILSKHPCVSEFYFARPEDGGTGKTYVKLL